MKTNHQCCSQNYVQNSENLNKFRNKINRNNLLTNLKGNEIEIKGKINSNNSVEQFEKVQQQ